MFGSNQATFRLPSKRRRHKAASPFPQMRHLRPVYLAALLCFAPAARTASGQQPDRIRPFFEARKQVSDYNGPGREEPEPDGLTEVRIGYFGPDDPKHRDGGDIWLAVSLAIEEANSAGGYRGLPFRLIPGWAENPWSTGASRVARMAYDEKVWAIIGGIDGPSTHIAEQIAAKARLTVINPAATDKTINLANVPWMFSAVPGDHTLASIIGRVLIRDTGDDPITVIGATDHDSHLFLSELLRFLARNGIAPRFRFEFQPGAAGWHRLVGSVLEGRPRTILLVAGAHDSAVLASELRQMGFTGHIFGGPAMARRAFALQLRAESTGLVFPNPGGPCTTENAFVRTFTARYRYPPDFAARCGYESARLLVAAVRRAGLNRARIRDAVRDLSPWQGIAVNIEWDNLGQNQLAGSCCVDPPATAPPLKGPGR